MLEPTYTETGELQERIHTWANKVFPNRTPYQQICKLVLEEIPEMVQAVDRGGDIEDEIADCFIILMDIATQHEIDVWLAVMDKMDINEGRTWAQDTRTGLMKHIKERKDILTSYHTCELKRGVDSTPAFMGTFEFKDDSDRLIWEESRALWQQDRDSCVACVVVEAARLEREEQ